MKKIKLHARSILWFTALVLGSVGFYAYTVFADEPLVLSQTSGTAPLIVSPTGPEKLVTALSNNSACALFGRRVVEIDWGDGTQPPETPSPIGGDPNAERLEKECLTHRQSHTYTKPGIYTINVTLNGWGPTDAATIEWSGSTKVEVKAP